MRSVDDSQFAVISGPRFLSAVTGFTASSSTIEETVRDYLAEDEQRRAPRRATDTA